jgi:nucleoside-diphosphate-sugar epimerase
MPVVAVTGGSGKLGRATVTDLLENGWEVINLDQNPPARPVCPFVRVDFSDYGQTASVLSGLDEIAPNGFDAVVHLAALPRPGLVPNAETFRNNVLSAYNVFTAAQRAGITNIVWASSESVLGLPFDNPPPRIPLDESQTSPEHTYSLGKFLEEQLAGVLCRWDPTLKMVGLRFSHVHDPEDYGPFPGFSDDPSLRAFNLWAYIDSRDGAQAVRRALEFDQPGVEVFIIAAADTVMTQANDELVAKVYPGVPYTPPAGKHDTLLSIDKARRLLGFNPEHSWRDHT